MKKFVVAEGSEENLDLLLQIAKKFDIKISDPTANLPNQKPIVEQRGNAYSPWSSEDDEQLEILYYCGKNVKELSEIFGRNEGAIRSRIKKLELFEKYGKKE